MINHVAAQQVYQQFARSSTIYDTIVAQMRNYGTLPGFITDICRKYIQLETEKTKGSLTTLLIVLAEAIYNGFGDTEVKKRLESDINFKDKTEDKLFDAVLDNVFYSIIRESDQEFSNIAEDVWREIVGDIANIYEKPMN